MRRDALSLMVIAVGLYAGSAVATGQRTSRPPSSTSRARAAAVRPARPSASKLDPTRFVPVAVVRDGELDEPMTFSVAKDGKVYIAERKGGLKVYDQDLQTIKTVAVVPTNHAYLDRDGKPVREAEEGLIGLALDPNFDQNHWIYLRYADPKEPKHVLSRFEIRNDQFVEGSRRDLLSFNVQRQQCCHVGGGITFDARGNLYMTNGANSPDDVSATAPDDLRGKILRIHPERDGTYTIPAGNLYPPGTPGTRPEIYAMGVRNPWRPTVDSKTGWLYWGEIGDQWDEFNQARRPGFFGWPYWDGDNVPRDIGAGARPPISDNVPPPQPAFISFDSTPGKIPALGAGTRCAVGGPIYHRADFDASVAAPVARVLGREVARHRLRSQLDHGGHDDRRRRLPVGRADRAALPAGHAARHEIRSGRRSLRARVRRELLHAERDRAPDEDSIPRRQSHAHGACLGEPDRGHRAVQCEVVGRGQRRSRWRRAEIQLDDRVQIPAGHRER